MRDGVGSAWRTGVRHAVGIGGLVACVELVALGSQLALPLGVRWWGLAAWSAASNVGLAALCAAGVGAILPRSVGPRARLSAAVGLASLVVILAAAAPGVTRLAAERQHVGASVLTAIAFGLCGAAVLQAGFWGQREWGRPDEEPPQPGRPFPAASLGLLAAGLGAVAGGLANGRAPAGSERTARGPSVVLVSVDGLRAGGEPAALAALTEGGIRFTQAVTPAPSSRAANATLLSGLHPLRHRVLDASVPLSRGHTTLFEALAEAGYATGGFVSSSEVGADSGLDQGMQRFDDDWALLARTALGRWLPQGHRGRSSEETAARFAAWAREQRRPYAAWIHLDATGPDGSAALARAAAILGEALGGAPGGLAVAVAGTRGEMSPSRGPGASPLLDDMVHVPFAVRLPGDAPAVTEVLAQVRLMDAASTLTSAAGLGELPQSEGVPLAGYGSGSRTAPLSISLVGQAADGRWQLGVRNNGLKVVFCADGRTELYLLDEDPDERSDRSADQPEVIAQAAGLLSPDRAALVSACGFPCADWRASR